MINNKMVKNKTIKTNGTIDFINGQRGFLSKVFIILFQNKRFDNISNYLMHMLTFNIDVKEDLFHSM